MKAFEIAIYAIVAIVLVFVFILLASQFFLPGNNFTEINTAITKANTQSLLGKTINLGVMNYAQNATVLTTQFDKTKMLVSIECNNANDCCQMEGTTTQKCDKKVKWDNTFFNVNQGKKIKTCVRCTRAGGLPVCKIFLGLTPAQTEIEKIELEQPSPIGETQIKLTLKNTGELPIAAGTNSVELSKYGPNGLETTDYTIQPKEITTIMPGERQVIYWTLNPTNIGRYSAKFNFTGQDAGFAEKEIDFNKTSAVNCKTTQTGETIFDPDTNGYKELHSCTGCDYAYQCVAAWMNAESGKNFLPYDKENAYCTKTTLEGNC